MIIMGKINKKPFSGSQVKFKALITGGSLADLGTFDSTIYIVLDNDQFVGAKLEDQMNMQGNYSGMVVDVTASETVSCSVELVPFAGQISYPSDLASYSLDFDYLN